MSLHLYNRRTMLKAGFTALALPFMESLALGKSVGTVSAKRFLFIGCGYGFSKHNFFPTKAGKFSKIGLTPGLKPLEGHKNDITMVSNLTNLGARNVHAGSTTYLTGADVGATRRTQFINSISLDQVLAQKIGQDTRFASLSLSGEGEGNDGQDPDSHSPGMIKVTRSQASKIHSHSIMNSSVKAKKAMKNASTASRKNAASSMPSSRISSTLERNSAKRIKIS